MLLPWTQRLFLRIRINRSMLANHLTEAPALRCRALGMTMQKPMFGDQSGLTDTMWDLIVNALGALIVSVIGYLYMKRGVKSVVARWIERFIDGNPGLFARK